MARQKGTAKTGGRKRGTPNKITATTKQWIESVLEGNRAAFVARLGQLTPIEFVKVYLSLLNYELPKRQAVGLQDLTPRELAKQMNLSTLSEEQRAAIMSLPDVATAGDDAKAIPPIVINIREAAGGNDAANY
jgi:hypothetical protein